MEETKITLESYLEKVNTGEVLYTRKYVPFNEKGDIIDEALSIIFGTFDEDGSLTDVNVYQEPNYLLDDLFIKTSVIKAYTGINSSNRVAIYDVFMKDGLYEKLLTEIKDAVDFEYMLDCRITEKREYIKENVKTSVDDTFDSITTLISTLNSKASEIDVKKLDKVIKKLNPQEIMKAYKNSGIGNDVRDKAIHEQAQEIIELKNQISARNVMANKTVE